MALCESQQITRIQRDQLSVAHGTRSFPGTPYFRFSQDYTVVNARCQRQSSTHTSTIDTASEENKLSLLPYGDRGHLYQLSFSHARPIAVDFSFTQGPDCTDASSNNASEENAFSLLANAANLLCDNLTGSIFTQTRQTSEIRPQETTANS